MRVLQLHYFGLSGGAGGTVAVRRLHTGLKKAGINSRFLCKTRTTDQPEIVQLQQSMLQKTLQSRLDKLETWVGLRSLALPGVSNELLRNDEYKHADVIHIHRMFDFIPYLSLPRITKDKPTIMTLHDMWAYTGHCYVSMDCDRWETGCGSCPHMDIFPKIKFDNTRLEWKLKNWAYKHSNLTVIALSKSMKSMAEKSMLSHCDIRYIPNGLDTDVYVPHDPQQCRKMLQIPENKKVLLAVTYAFQQYNKGSDLLIKSLRRLPSKLKSNVVLVMFGNHGINFAKHLDMQYIDLGYISSDAVKAMAYAAADLFLCPSRGEAFGLVTLESISCGTPVLSFNVSGVNDIVRPGLTGNYAEPEDVEGFVSNIIDLLDNDSLRMQMRRECRSIAVNEYDIGVIVQKHIDLYSELLGKKHV